MSADDSMRLAQMRADIFDGTPQAAAQARAFYTGIVGVPAIVRLTVALRLDLTEGGQDWAIEVADGDRLDELLDSYENAGLDPEERYWLLELIVASLDERLRIAGDDEAIGARVHRHLVAAFAEHRGTVRYWACLDEPQAERFAVTRMMRAIWRAHGI